jgi:hypothetical protein
MTITSVEGARLPLSEALAQANITRTAFDAVRDCGLTLQEAYDTLIDRNSWRD